ncbi:MAG: D-alanyl-D-alanine carboxypeptidase family protein [Micropepsaceae bacterium]
MLTRRSLITASLAAAVLPGLGRASAAAMQGPHAVPGLSPADLSWPGAKPEEMAFMREVYVAHLSRSGARGAFSGDIPREKLGEIEEGVLLSAGAARDARALLSAARIALKTAKAVKPKPDAAAVATKAIGPLSGYRPASRQFALWNRAFPSYFEETAPVRAALPGGPLGRQAVEETVEFVRHHLAAPGFSLHNSGKALDFTTTVNGEMLISDRTQRAAWRASWFYDWLTASAPSFGFYENPKIDEPWHWEWRG